ncbi:MAG TPA: alpha/beta fold hydrolase [Asticcacaulis sp.]|nr:alpha/beta fold hydrolase [Asticcacaulis sp.]
MPSIYRHRVLVRLFLAFCLCVSSADAAPKPYHPAKPAAVKTRTIKAKAPIQPAAPPLPAALFTDPPRDPAHPAENVALRLNSHGSLMNAVFYLASGEQPHPTVLLLHGLPGNEQPLDLAQTLRRAGYNVLYIHYRGSWGSAGTFSLTHSVEDGQAAVDFLLDPVNVAIYHIDASKVIVIGHSMGGFAAVRIAAAEPRVAAIGLIAPWDISDDLGMLTVPQADFAKTAAKAFNDVDGRLGTVTSLDIAKEILADGHDWKLASSAQAIANRPILIVTATHDDSDDKAGHLIQTLAPAQTARLKTTELDSDHAFSDHRIALQVAVLTWLKDSGL